MYLFYSLSLFLCVCLWFLYANTLASMNGVEWSLKNSTQPWQPEYKMGRLCLLFARKHLHPVPPQDVMECACRCATAELSPMRLSGSHSEQPIAPRLTLLQVMWWCDARLLQLSHSVGTHLFLSGVAVDRPSSRACKWLVFFPHVNDFFVCVWCCWQRSPLW